MACRAAVLGEFHTSGIILLGGDIPPELKKLDRMGRILLCRGQKDRFYTLEKWKEDIARINQLNIEASFCTFDGGHEGNDDYFYKAGEFLRQFAK
jgi:predicted esterase